MVIFAFKGLRVPIKTKVEKHIAICGIYSFLALQ